MYDDHDVLNPGPPIDEQAIVALELRHGRVIPNSLRKFLLWRNGGLPRRKGWPIDIVGMVELRWPPSVIGEDNYSDIRKIWKIDPSSKKFDDFDFVFETYVELPNFVLPISSSSGGSLYFMDTREGKEPRVLYRNYLNPSEAAVVAQDFHGFLDAIRSEHEIKRT